MKHNTVNLVLLCLLCLLWLSSCGQERPRLEPEQDIGYAPGRGTLILSADTNCVNAGEVVTFTLQVKNQERYPLRFAGERLFDIVLSSIPGEPTYRWSDTDQYPADINPVFAPGEVRVYTWSWIADGVYGLNRHDPGVTVRVASGALAPQDTIPQGNEAGFGIGVDYKGFQLSSLPCRDLRR